MDVTAEDTRAGDGTAFSVDLAGCTVTGAAHGDLSSEKVYARLRTLTCAGSEPGTVVETEVAGFVAGAGKTGVRGPVVSREGVLVEKAFLAGRVHAAFCNGFDIARRSVFKPLRVPLVRVGKAMESPGDSGWNAPTIEDLNGETEREFDWTGVRETTEEDLARVELGGEAESEVVQSDGERLGELVRERAVGPIDENHRTRDTSQYRPRQGAIDTVSFPMQMPIAEQSVHGLDVVFDEGASGAVIFVHGCFWHGHDCPMFRLPRTRTEFWREKFMGNRERDGHAVRSLRNQGWRVLTVWECAHRGSGTLPADDVLVRCRDFVLEGDVEHAIIAGTW